MISKKTYLLVLFLSCCQLSVLFGQLNRIDSLKLALKNAKHDTVRCNVLSILAETASDEEWPSFNAKLKELAEKNIGKDDPNKNLYLKYLADALNNLGFLAYQNGEIPLALEYFHKSLKIYEDINNKEGVATFLNNLATIYQAQGDVSKALEYYHKSLKIREAKSDKVGIAGSFVGIGTVYLQQGDLSKALDFFIKGLNIQEELGNKSGIAVSLNNVGSVYHRKGILEKAILYYEKGLKIYEEIGDKAGVALCLNNVAGIYASKGDTKKALEFSEKCLKLREEIGDKRGVGGSLTNIADLLFKTGHTDQSLISANKSMFIAKQLGFPEDIRNSSIALKNIFKKQNKYKEAFEMYELEIKMRDSINNQETQKASVKKQLQYDYDKKELLMQAEQDKKDVIAKEELKQKEKERNYFIAGFGLVMVLALFIFRGYKQKQKDNALIIHQKHLVEEKQKEILDSIHYAKRIQTALMGSERHIDRTLSRLNKD